MTAPVIILSRPQLGENIGAAARAMKNFGLSDLRLVAPRDGWPNEKADAIAVGAVDVVQAAADAGMPLRVRLATLFHDLGKPHVAWRGNDRRLHFYARRGHRDHADTNAAKGILRRGMHGQAGCGGRRRPAKQQLRVARRGTRVTLTGAMEVPSKAPAFMPG